MFEKRQVIDTTISVLVELPYFILPVEYSSETQAIHLVGALTSGGTDNIMKLLVFSL